MKLWGWVHTVLWHMDFGTRKFRVQISGNPITSNLQTVIYKLRNDLVLPFTKWIKIVCILVIKFKLLNTYKSIISIRYSICYSHNINLCLKLVSNLILCRTLAMLRFIGKICSIKGLGFFWGN